MVFFLAENVAGMLHDKHEKAFTNILKLFDTAGYNVTHDLLNAKDYNVPQDRKRVIFVGFRKDLKKGFEFPEAGSTLTLKDAIWDLRTTAKSAKEYNKTRGDSLSIPNHEYMNGGFSTIYMSRNRVRNWDEPSYTIQAGGRHAPIHPQAPKMTFIHKNKREFVKGKEDLYRRLSVRECARIQTFPDDFIFEYDSIADGYKMVGNAVPVNFAYVLAEKIKKDLRGLILQKSKKKEDLALV